VRILGYRLEQVGLNFSRLSLQLAVWLTGIVFGIAEYFILTPDTMVAELTWQEIWLPALMFLVCTGFVEEFVFRGVLQRIAVEAFGGWGIVYVGLLFAVVHMIHYSEIGLNALLIDMVFVFVVALFFGWVVKKTGSLFGVTLAHGLINIVLYLVAPFFF